MKSARNLRARKEEVTPFMPVEEKKIRWFWRRSEMDNLTGRAGILIWSWKRSFGMVGTKETFCSRESIRRSSMSPATAWLQVWYRRLDKFCLWGQHLFLKRPSLKCLDRLLPRPVLLTGQNLWKRCNRLESAKNPN